jgi:hypothetical protein
MIAGPILPRRADGLWEAIRKDPERLERGLRVVRRELVLHASLGVGACGGAEGEGLVIDALGADAVGAPVLLFIAQLEQDRCLPARISEATEWFARNAAMLTPILDGDGVRLDLPARVFVVGFEFTASCMERLSALSQAAGAGRCTPADVSAFRVEGLVLDGVHHVGVARVLGGAGDGRLRAPAESELGKRCEQLAELLECLDPELTQDGEPYARTWRCQGTTILRLERDARRVRAVIPTEGEVELLQEEDLADACDLAMRRYLTVVRGEDAVVRIESDPVESGQRARREAGVEVKEFSSFFEGAVEEPAPRGEAPLGRGVRRGDAGVGGANVHRRGGSARAADLAPDIEE